MPEQEHRQTTFARARKLGHHHQVGDQTIPSRITKVSERFDVLGGAPVPAMVASIDVIASLVQKLGNVRIAERMLAHAMRDLYDSRRARRRTPSIVSDLQSVAARERKFVAAHMGMRSKPKLLRLAPLYQILAYIFARVFCGRDENRASNRNYLERFRSHA